MPSRHIIDADSGTESGVNSVQFILPSLLTPDPSVSNLPHYLGLRDRHRTLNRASLNVRSEQVV